MMDSLHKHSNHGILRSFQTIDTVSMAELAQSCPNAKLQRAFNKYVKPRQLKDWRRNSHQDRMPAPPNPTEEKIELFQETLAWLAEKSALLEHEAKWQQWAMKRIHELKYPPIEVVL
jgi:hypothetical protein